jgi:mycothiol synthase
MTTIHARPFAGDEDIAAITQFLLDTYLLNQTLHNWEPRRWQGNVYHGNDAHNARHRARLPELVHIWHDQDGQIVGATLSEDEGAVFLQIHPQHRALEAEMLTWAETHLAQLDDSGRRWLEVWCYDYDAYRVELLRRRGYTRTEAHENVRRRSLAIPIPEIPAPDGYTVRAMRVHPDDWRNQAALLNAAFRRDFHNAEEYRNFQRAPVYRLDLDIVVEAPDGTLAANAGFSAHERESFSVAEPVCTHPDHAGLGLARVAMAEGLRRVQALGIQTAYVGAWYSNPAANHIYEQMGFTEFDPDYLWRREW